jgi:hypothetical protein
MKTIKTLVTFFQLGLLISLLGACGSEPPSLMNPQIPVLAVTSDLHHPLLHPLH